MPYWRLYYHLVWATHRRLELITPEVEAIVRRSLVECARKHDVRVYAVDGWVEHLHMVVSIPPKLSVATVVGLLKGASSYAVNAELRFDPPFRWQRGYGSLSVGERQLEIVVAYVEAQKRRHGGAELSERLERSADSEDGTPHAGPAGMRERSAGYAADDYP